MSYSNTTPTPSPFFNFFNAAYQAYPGFNPVTTNTYPTNFYPSNVVSTNFYPGINAVPTNVQQPFYGQPWNTTNTYPGFTGNTPTFFNTFNPYAFQPNVPFFNGNIGTNTPWSNTWNSNSGSNQFFAQFFNQFTTQFQTQFNNWFAQFTNQIANQFTNQFFSNTGGTFNTQTTGPVSNGWSFSREAA